jgi:ATP-binding cassette subfamily B protein
MDGADGFLSVMNSMLGVVSLVILIAAHVWWAALVIIGFSVPLYWLSVRAGKQNYKAKQDSEKFNRRAVYLSETLTNREGADERALFGYGEHVNDRWSEQFESGRVLQLKISIKYWVATKTANIILAVIAALIALTLINPVVTKEVSAGLFMGIVSAVFGMVRTFGGNMSRSVEAAAHSGAYMKDLTAFLKLSEAEGALDEPDENPAEFSSIEFKDVRFKYPTGEDFVLDGISFKLDCGRHYAFVGKNGAGKTTVTKLLTGLYTEYDGEILINGRDIKSYPPSALKAMFSVVYQDFAQYYIPLKDNVALGDIRSPGGEAEAARLAGLDETIAELKNGIDTPLGKILDGGQDISGGQWQRVAIARSIKSRAPVKILDEPTAALDPISESRIYGEFEKLMAGKTTVFISHRLGSTKLADEILVIDGGRVTERGSHTELMKLEGQYAEMFESQREWYI